MLKRPLEDVVKARLVAELSAQEKTARPGEGGRAVALRGLCNLGEGIESKMPAARLGGGGKRRAAGGSGS